MKPTTVLLIDVDGQAWPEPVMAVGIGHLRQDLVLVTTDRAIELGSSWKTLSVERVSAEREDEGATDQPVLHVFM